MLNDICSVNICFAFEANIIKKGKLYKLTCIKGGFPFSIEKIH